MPTSNACPRVTTQCSDPAACTCPKGQQQRIGLAQAILALRDRKILILDEFTSALDSLTEQQIIDNLKPLLEGKTVIIIAHRLATLRKLADRIVVLERGSIVEDGSHKELVSQGARYAELVRLQSMLRTDSPDNTEQGRPRLSC